LEGGKKKIFYDKCPFIWKKYASQGYLTVYGEDAPWMGIFNYLKKGFKSQPTDYYLRPLTNELDKKLGSLKMTNAKLCYGPRLGFAVVLNYLKSIVSVNSPGHPYFAFIWATSLFHDNGILPQLGDDLLLEYLQWMESEGHLENTILILMSDHGMRFGNLRATKQGKFEERLPFVHFVFPSWFRRKYATAVDNLKRNANRLTTPFDIYETLNDLVDLDSLEKVNKTWNEENIPRGISLFEPIPLFRTCDLASIPYQWCTCLTRVVLEVKSAAAQNAAKAFVDLINQSLENTTQCAVLELKSVQSAEEIVMSTKTKFEKVYDVSIETYPGDARFQSTIAQNLESKAWKISDSLSRINMYGNQSHCVGNKELKKVCFCVDLVQNINSSYSFQKVTALSQ